MLKQTMVKILKEEPYRTLSSWLYHVLISDQHNRAPSLRRTRKSFLFLWKGCIKHSHKLSILHLLHSLIGVGVINSLFSKISWEQREFIGGEQSGKAKKVPVVKVLKAALRFDIDNLFSIQNVEPRYLSHSRQRAKWILKLQGRDVKHKLLLTREQCVGL